MAAGGETAVDVALGVGAAAGGVEEAAGGLPPPEPLGPQFPFGGLPPLPWTLGPGFGNARSPSSVVQPFPMLALKMSGNDGPDRPDPPPVMVIAAQFMYISRFPSLLNQVLSSRLISLEHSTTQLYMKEILTRQI